MCCSACLGNLTDATHTHTHTRTIPRLHVKVFRLKLIAFFRTYKKTIRSQAAFACIARSLLVDFLHFSEPPLTSHTPAQLCRVCERERANWSRVTCIKCTHAFIKLDIAGQFHATTTTTTTWTTARIRVILLLLHSRVRLTLVCGRGST